MSLDLEIESLGGSGVDGNPILNNRSLASTVTVAGGQTTMLATLVTSNETKVLDGVPDLSDLPGFQSTNKSTNGTRNEILITITPHVVNGRAMQVLDRRVILPRSGTVIAASPTRP